MSDGIRQSSIKGGLSSRFTILLWMVVLPPLALATLLSFLFGTLVLGIDRADVLPIVLFGGGMMALQAPVVTFLYRDSRAPPRPRSRHEGRGQGRPHPAGRHRTH
jgi:hypothetical protein